MAAAQAEVRRGRRPAALAALLVCGALAAGCGAPATSTDVGKFVARGSTPQQRQILRSIGLYRTSKDYPYACSLITAHFLKARYFNVVSDCEDLSRQAPRVLPISAHVQSVSGDRARVQIREATGTRSVYVMQDVAGTWKIDDIADH